MGITIHKLSARFNIIFYTKNAIYHNFKLFNINKFFILAYLLLIDINKIIYFSFFILILHNSLLFSFDIFD